MAVVIASIIVCVVAMNVHFYNMIQEDIILIGVIDRRTQYSGHAFYGLPDRPMQRENIQVRLWLFKYPFSCPGGKRSILTISLLIFMSLPSAIRCTTYKDT